MDIKLDKKDFEDLKSVSMCYTGNNLELELQQKTGQ